MNTSSLELMTAQRTTFSEVMMQKFMDKCTEEIRSLGAPIKKPRLEKTLGENEEEKEHKPPISELPPPNPPPPPPAPEEPQEYINPKYLELYKQYLRY